MRVALFLGPKSHAPAAVAAERLGYYKEANLKVEFTVYRGGAAAPVCIRVCCRWISRYSAAL